VWEFPDARTVPRSCPEGATGESPGWNPGDHAHHVLRALKGHTEPGACDPAPRLCASARDHVPFGQQMGREVLAQRRWGAEGEKRVIATVFAAWRLGGFVSPVCP
jgi:hypothetical protein